MKPELERIKNDMETIQKAMGLNPSMGRDWIQWMKRDRWSGLWWCVPGLICIAAALLPIERTQKFLGMVFDQWAGLLVAASLVTLGIAHSRKINGKDGRPEGLVRESKRANGMSGEGIWFGCILAVQLLLFFAWGRHYHIAFEPLWPALFLIMGSSCLVAALAAKARILLGFAIPFLGYGACLPLVGGNHKMNDVLLGLMFIAVALMFSLIQFWQIRQLERQHESH